MPDFAGIARRNAGTLCVLIAYCMVYVALICKGHGVPYVIDNNETFSALNHAYNLWHFDFFKSYGLTDEAISPFADAHPVVHTHQGDFPRLFSFLLFAVGARTVEAQIWMTTFTVGLASILFANSFFRRVAGDLFATIAVLMLISDYVLFAEWQVNTYRVWHGFFLFGALLCVHGLFEWKRWHWVLLTILLYAGLLYWEPVFAAFVAVTAGTYALWLYRCTPRLIVVAGLTQTIGAALGLGILVLQLVLFLGWQDFVTDIRLTYLSRNLVSDATIQDVREFYQSRNLVFWANFQSGATYYGLGPFVRSISAAVLQVATPLFILVAANFSLVALLPDSCLRDPSDAKAANLRQSLFPTIILASTISVLFCAVIFDTVIGSMPTVSAHYTFLTLFEGVAIPIIALATADGLRRLAAAISVDGAPPGLHRCALAGAFLLVMSIFIIVQWVLYHRSDQVLFDWLLPLSGLVAKLAEAAIVLSATLFFLTGRRTMLGAWQNVPRLLVPFFCCGFVGYFFSYGFNAGYLHSGYIYRFCPFLVFHADAFLALGPFLATATCINLAGRIPISRARSTLRELAIVSTAVLSGAVAVSLFGYWALIQLKYIAILPPDRFAFVPMLRGLAAPNEGIVSNTYSVPFGYVAGTWSYMDPTFEPRLEHRPVDVADASGFEDYLWLADRRSNPAYQRPGLYVCFKPASYGGGLVTPANVVQDGTPHCPDPSALRSAPGEEGTSGARLIAGDAKAGSWGIYRLDWGR
jgi:hypothetical protein